ncbi:hypothetical protein X777_07632 [Ooceraea biroi]|uniref:Reverse transcriptase domain-containing protein n=1 Tax=Ooceraea biroi TaxID=2015173 RepID=A0A026X3E0_OOCBI|nr:hypothetical protein X777_07632 [Ooceraea biroi]
MLWIKWGDCYKERKDIHRIYTLYADDLVLLLEEEDSMRSMMGRLEGYLEKKEIELNTDMAKTMRFRRGEREY